MNLRTLFPTLIAGLVAAALPLTAADAGSIKDCEKITAADAYNQCLAEYGPVAHEHELKPVPADIGSGKMYGRHHFAHSKHGHAPEKIETSVTAGSNVD